jgi:hypothetical protein
MEETGGMVRFVKVWVFLLVAACAGAWPQTVPGAPHATLVLYRNSSPIGGTYKPSVFDEEGELLWMENGRYATFSLKPGAHTITSTMIGNSVKLDVKPGETYYVCVTMATYAQNDTFRGSVAEVAGGMAKAAVAKLKPADAADLKW